MWQQCSARFEHGSIILAVSHHSNIKLCVRVIFPIHCRGLFSMWRKKTPSQRDEVLGEALAIGWQYQSVRYAATVEIDCRDIFVVLRVAFGETGQRFTWASTAGPEQTELA